MIENICEIIRLVVLVVTLGGSLLTVRKWFNSLREELDKESIITNLRQEIKLYYLFYCNKENKVEIPEHVLMDIDRVLVEAREKHVNGATSFMQKSLRELINEHTHTKK